MKNYQKYIALISLSTLLVACGGSGNGSNNNQMQSAKPESVENKKPIENNLSNATEKEKQPVKPESAENKKPIENNLSNVTEKEKQPVKPESVENKKPIENNLSNATEKEKQPVKPESAENKKPIENNLSNVTEKEKQPVKPESAENKKTNEKKLNVSSEIDKLAGTWFAGGGSEYSKDGVRVYKLIKNDQNYADDQNFKEKKLEFIQLKSGLNETKDYILTLLDDNVYYGFYRDSADMFKVNNNYVYSFNEKAENKGDLNQLVATYRGHFVYSLKSNPNIATTSDVHLTYTKGKAEGKVYSRQVKDFELFDIKDNNGDLRLLEFNPLVEYLDNAVYGDELVVRKNSPDRIIVETHFINGQDGTPNKHLVGKGQNDKYWGVLGAKKVE